MKRSRILGFAVGGLLLLGGIATLFIDFRSEPPPPPETVRPLKTLLVGARTGERVQRYPGRVNADQEVNLAFEVSGQVVERPANKGDQVEQGQLLAKLDPRDFESELNTARAELQRAKAQLERVEQAAESNAVSQQDLSNAQAAFDSAQAQVNIKQKALEDTELRATFSGLIANTFVEEFQNIQAKEAILSLQNIESIDIDVQVPEQRIIEAQLRSGVIRRPNEPEKATVSTFHAEFEYVPGRKFPVTFKNISTEADQSTQTYQVTFTMPQPEDIQLLPGMTATIVDTPVESETEITGGPLSLPIGVVPVDGQGQYYVWKVVSDESGGAYVTRVDVEVGALSGDRIEVLSGLEPGARIAAAGVTLLHEGQRVRVLPS